MLGSGTGVGSKSRRTGDGDAATLHPRAYVPLSLKPYTLNSIRLKIPNTHMPTPYTLNSIRL